MTISEQKGLDGGTLVRFLWTVSSSTEFFTDIGGFWSVYRFIYGRWHY